MLKKVYFPKFTRKPEDMKLAEVIDKYLASSEKSSFNPTKEGSFNSFGQEVTEVVDTAAEYSIQLFRELRKLSENGREWIAGVASLCFEKDLIMYTSAEEPSKTTFPPAYLMGFVMGITLANMEFDEKMADVPEEENKKVLQ